MNEMVNEEQFLNVEVSLTEHPDDATYHDISRASVEQGNSCGRKRFGEEAWHNQCFPSKERLRIWTPTQVSGKDLTIGVTPYQWCDLQAYKQVQPNEDFGVDDPIRYHLNAVALTGNGVIQTGDDMLVFHCKKGGAKEGSIHTFGGYASQQDLKAGGIGETILRELSEKNEVGLKREEMELVGLFGTEEGMPSILWDFGTGAVYGVVKTPLNFEAVQERVRAIPARESLVKKLHGVPITGVRYLHSQGNIHPQTRQVLSVLEKIYD